MAEIDWSPTERLSTEDKQRLVRYITALLPESDRKPTPTTLWHYTTGEGLIGILGSGKVFATHVSCLNDRLEHRHLPNLIDKELVERLSKSSGRRQTLFNALLQGVRTRAVARESAFVTSFTDKPDDLGQWRGYGGGECGFAIGFNARLLVLRAQRRLQTQVLRIRYDDREHQRLASAILDQIVQLAEDDLSTDSGFWDEYRDFVGWVFALAKHPKFDAEQEWRLMTRLHGHSELHFRQKRTLLSRYIELDLAENKQLPITAIMVGPGGDQEVSQVSVADLLAKYGYSDISIGLSQVPYRIP